MSYGQLAGRYYSLSGQHISLFGLPGGFHDSQWYVGIWCDTGYVPIEVACEPISPSIVRCIASDVANGQGHRLYRLVVSSQTAVVLFLEGLLTYQHFQSAYEGDGTPAIPAFLYAQASNGFIEIPHFSLAGYTFLLTIIPAQDAAYSFGTLDHTGNVV